MTKSELISNLAARFPQLVTRDAEMSAAVILTAIAHTLKEGQRVEIRGFGSFTVTERAQRMGRNPKTGDQVVVPSKRVPHFKAGKDLRERVDLQR
jgi:integration host factor subunit beta